MHAHSIRWYEFRILKAQLTKRITLGQELNKSGTALPWQGYEVPAPDNNITTCWVFFWKGLLIDYQFMIYGLDAATDPGTRERRINVGTPRTQPLGGQLQGVSIQIRGIHIFTAKLTHHSYTVDRIRARGQLLHVLMIMS